jgi:hypothetical protein
MDSISISCVQQQQWAAGCWRPDPEKISQTEREVKSQSSENTFGSNIFVILFFPFIYSSRASFYYFYLFLFFDWTDGLARLYKTLCIMQLDGIRVTLAERLKHK